jgi:hypothetical protein
MRAPRWHVGTLTHALSVGARYRVAQHGLDVRRGQHVQILADRGVAIEAREFVHE